MRAVYVIGTAHEAYAAYEARKESAMCGAHGVQGTRGVHEACNAAAYLKTGLLNRARAGKQEEANQ